MFEQTGSCRNELARMGAVSRGFIASLRGEGRGANPFDETSCYYDHWVAGFEQGNAVNKTRTVINRPLVEAAA